MSYLVWFYPHFHHFHLAEVCPEPKNNFTSWNVLGLLQHLYPVIDLQIKLSTLKRGPNDSPYPKTFMPIISNLFFTSSSSSAATKKAAVKYLTYAKAGISKNERYEIWLVKTSRIKEGINLRQKRLAFSFGRRLWNLIIITKIDMQVLVPQLE